MTETLEDILSNKYIDVDGATLSTWDVKNLKSLLRKKLKTCRCLTPPAVNGTRSITYCGSCREARDFLSLL